MDTKAGNTEPKKSKASDSGEAVAIPATWPGAFDAFKLVKPAVVKVIWLLIGAVAAYIVVDVVFSAIFGRIPLVANIFSYILEALFTASVITIYFAALRNTEITFSEAFNNGLSKMLTMLILLVLTGIILVVSFILLIVPFFIVLPRLIFAPYLVIEQDLSVGDALSTSWKMSKGHSGKVYGIIGIDLLLALLCITIIGIPFAIYWGLINYGSLALLALYVIKNGPVEAAASPVPTTTVVA